MEGALAVVERACALAGTAYRLALCQAIEAATDSTPSRRARVTRVLFAEIERILARLWTLGMSARAASLPHLLADALEQREALFAALTEATGERVFWGIAVQGGVRDDLELGGIASALKHLDAGLAQWQLAVAPKGPLGQLGTAVGKISPERAEALSGLAARGSLALADARRKQPNDGYADLRNEIEWAESSTERAGDVAERLRCAVDDIEQSLAIIRSASGALGDAPAAAGSAKPAKAKAPVPGPKGSARVETPHGSVEMTVTLASADRISALRIVPPGQALLAALPELLVGSKLTQVPLILASLDLCVECLDL
jgi:Ni,Fe-hydrogenase III large subunit